MSQAIDIGGQSQNRVTQNCFTSIRELDKRDVSSIQGRFPYSSVTMLLLCDSLMSKDIGSCPYLLPRNTTVLGQASRSRTHGRDSDKNYLLGRTLKRNLRSRKEGDREAGKKLSTDVFSGNSRFDLFQGEGLQNINTLQRHPCLKLSLGVWLLHIYFSSVLMMVSPRRRNA